MAEQHHQTVSIETVTLEVKDLEKVSQFYQEIIGLSVLSEDKQHIALGIDENKEPLIILTAEGEYELVTGPRNGLFHIALLLPSRADLGDVLKLGIVILEHLIMVIRKHFIFKILKIMALKFM